MDNKNKWYDNANMITSLIIGTILLIIIFTQSFALRRNGSIELFTSIINHNSVYLFILIYFILLKFYVGKRYFNYLSVFVIFIYFIITTTSFLTVIQAFSLITSLDFLLNTLLLIYMVHTLMRDTRIWREFMFYSIIVVSIILLAVNLISTIVISGVFISVLDTVYIVLMARYIYLYRIFLDKKKIDVGDTMNLEDVKKKIDEVDKKISNRLDEFGNDINNYVKEKEIDKKIDKAKKEVVKTAKDIGKQVGNVAKETVDDIKDSFSDNKKNVKGVDK